MPQRSRQGKVACTRRASQVQVAVRGRQLQWQQRMLEPGPFGLSCNSTSEGVWGDLVAPALLRSPPGNAGGTRPLIAASARDPDCIVTSSAAGPIARACTAPDPLCLLAATRARPCDRLTRRHFAAAWPQHSAWRWRAHSPGWLLAAAPSRTQPQPPRAGPWSAARQPEAAPWRPWTAAAAPPQTWRGWRQSAWHRPPPLARTAPRRP